MKHPLQRMKVDDDGVLRFIPNAIVRFLLDAGPFDLNQLALMPWDDEDRAQLAQLIGYSHSVFGELSYVSDEVWSAAESERKRVYSAAPEASNE